MKKLIFGIIAITLIMVSCKKKEVSPLVYVANITQIDSAAPFVSIHENTIGAIEWGRIVKGYYIGKMPIFPDVGRIWVDINQQTINGDTGPTIRTNGPGEILIESYYQGAHHDGMLINTPIEIRVYQ